MNQKTYAIDYISRVTTQDTIETPSAEKAGEFFDTLQALHENHCAGGARGALAGWNAVKKYVPDLNQKRKLISFNELDFLEIPDYVLPESEEGTAPNYALYARGMNMLYGNPGSGKSFIAIDIAARVAAAHPDRVVVYAAGEGKHGLSGRLKAWEKHHKTKVSNLYLWTEALPFLDNAEVDRFYEELGNRKPVFIIVDTLARSMLGVNENDTKETGLYIHAVERVMSEFDCGVLLIHHTNKAGIMRGSTVLNGALDSVLRLDKQESLISIFNSYDRGGKNKHREELPPVFLRLLTVRVNDVDEAVVVLNSRIAEDPTDDTLSDNEFAILECLSGYEHGLHNRVITDAIQIHRSTVYRNLQKLLKKQYVTYEPTNELYTMTNIGKTAFEKALEG